MQPLNGHITGVNYFNTFAPVAKLVAIRLVLAMATAEDLELHQINIKGAYLNGELTDHKVIYIHATALQLPFSQLAKTHISTLQNAVWTQTVWLMMVSKAC